jgi:hypothetical protein
MAAAAAPVAGSLDEPGGASERGSAAALSETESEVRLLQRY